MLPHWSRRNRKLSTSTSILPLCSCPAKSLLLRPAGSSRRYPRKAKVGREGYAASRHHGPGRTREPPSSRRRQQLWQATPLVGSPSGLRRAIQVGDQIPEEVPSSGPAGPQAKPWDQSGGASGNRMSGSIRAHPVFVSCSDRNGLPPCQWGIKGGANEQQRKGKGSRRRRILATAQRACAMPCQSPQRHPAEP